MNRTPINPWEWSKQYQFNQAEIVEGAARHLMCSGQTSIGPDGTVQHPNEIGPQIDAAMDNLEAVLAQGDMGLANVVKLTVYTTDVDGMLANWDRFASRLAKAGVAPPNTLIGVARLAFPELMVEIDATAAD